MERYDIERSVARLLDSSKGAPDDFIGTAFFIDPFHLLTAEHCIRPHTGNDKLCIDSFEGHGNHKVEIVESDSELDIALLKVTSSSFPSSAHWIPVAISKRQVEKGTDCTVYGFSKETPQLDDRTRKVLNYDDEYDILRLDHSIAKGMSGSALLDDDGLIGMIIERNPDSACHNARPVGSFAQWVDQEVAWSRKVTLPSWMRPYLSTLQQSVEDLPSDQMLSRLTESETGIYVNTREVYVPLHVPNKEQLQDPPSPNQKGKNADQKHTPLIDSVAQNNLMVVVGDPGSGKSTFLRYLATRLISYLEGEDSDGQEHEERLPQDLNYRVPIFIDLKELYWKLLDQNNKLLDRPLSARGLKDAILSLLEDNYPDCFTGSQTDSFLRGLTPFKPMWLLDGLDEINLTLESRSHFIDGLAKWSTSLPSDRRVCLTTRPYAYHKQHIRGFHSTQLEPLQGGDINAFIIRFFKTTGTLFHPKWQQDKLDNQARILISILRDPHRKALREIVSNPLLLTLTTALYCKRGRDALPRDRAELYERCLRELLKRWEEKSTTEKGECSLHDMISPMGMTTALNQLGYTAHLGLTNATSATQDNGDFPVTLLEKAFKDSLHSDYDTTHVIDYLQNKTGIINDRFSQQYGFIHRSFREFLAARFIATNDSVRALESLRAACTKNPGWWREVLALAVRIGDKSLDAALRPTGLLSHLLFSSPEDMPTQDWTENPWIYAEAIANAESERDTPERLQWGRSLLRRRCVHWLTSLVEENQLAESPELRNQAAITLSRLGDPRKGVGLVEGNPHLPDIEWVEIAEGSVSLEDGAGDFEVDSAFLLARYPVTNVQFQAFVDAPDGYESPEWWNAIEKKKTKPSASRWNDNNHPKTGVSWYEAIAYCRWLTHQMRSCSLIDPSQEIRLPTEMEWQLAATGGEPENIYPRGKNYREGSANIHETFSVEQVGTHFLGKTSAVGLYHYGQSTDGLFDMSGNVWEWCLNNYDSPEKTKIDSSWETKPLRGGAWNFRASYARCSYRFFNNPDFRNFDIGFRLLCSPPSLSTDH